MNFSTTLINWYSVNKRDFPWRNTKDPYFIWLSEIILQQTRTEQGLPYYLKFVKNYPTIIDLANASQTDVLKLWQGLGYYSRARNLHFTANYIVANLNGIFPTNHKDLLKLKGIGDYTASAIASICYDEQTAVVDGNVYRVLSRFFDVDYAINSTKGKKYFKELAQSLMVKVNTGNYNQAIMDFGATICTPKKPLCNTCIFNNKCKALQLNKVTVLPTKIKKNSVKKRYFNYLVLISLNKKTIITKRVKKDIWLNLYEFPLIETQLEITKTTLIKNLMYQKIVNNLGAKPKLFNIKTVVHKLSHQHIYTKFWIIKLDKKLEKGIAITTLKKYPVSTLVHNFIAEFFI